MGEVRRCARCAAAAVVEIRAWQGSAFAGLVQTGPTGDRDLVCQSCGARYLWQPPRRGLLAGVFGLMMSSCAFFSIVGGLIAGAAEGNWGGLVLAAVLVPFASVLLWMATAPWRLDRALAIAPGAPMPPMRFTRLEDARRCTCGGVARCTAIVVHSRGRGREETYACTSCKKEFRVDSPMQAIATALGSVVALAAGTAMLATASGQGAGAWVCAGSIALLGVFGAVSFVLRLVARLRHPTTAIEEPAPTSAIAG